MKWRGIFVGDNHAGSYYGLTPPDYWAAPALKQVRYLQQALWEWFEGTVKGIGPVDDVIHVGDGVEGPGKKDSLDIQYNEMDVQVEIGAASFDWIDRKHMHMCYGTPYHVTTDQDHEKAMAAMLRSRIEDELRLEALGVNMSIRHVVGNSQTPYGHATQIRKEAVNDLLRGAMEKYAWAHLLARGHVHQYTMIDTLDQRAFSNPCLKLPYDRFGRKLRTLNYHVGLTEVEIVDGEITKFKPHAMRMAEWRPIKYHKLK